MKLEPRGKYAGIKIHLDKDETEHILGLNAKATSPHDVNTQNFKSREFVIKLGKKIHRLMQEHPDLLKDKSDEDVAKMLEYEAEKASKKLVALKSGKQWQNVK